MIDKKIKDAFRSIEVSESEIYNEVSQNIKEKKQPLKSSVPRKLAVACISIGLIGTLVLITPSLYSFAKNIVKPWIVTITGDNKTVEHKGFYVEMNNTKESRTSKKYSTLTEIEEVVGIDLLESNMAYKDAENLITYTPSMIGDQIYAAYMTNDQYAVGDVKNLKISNNTDDISDVASAHFEKGKQYLSTLSCQINIRGERPDNIAGAEGEEDSWDLENIEIMEHPLRNIDTKAIIYESATDSGSSDSFDDIIDENTPMTHALVLYKGIEYHYAARISVDSMKAFLDTLEEELDADGNSIYKAIKPSGWVDLDKFPTMQLGTPKFNENGELVLKGPMTYEVGRGDFVEGHYDIVAVSNTDSNSGFPISDGQKIKNYLFFDSNNFLLEEGGEMILKRAEYEKIPMKGDTYILDNTSGEFLSGTQIKEGTYQVSLKLDKKPEIFGVIVRNYKVSEGIYHDTYIKEFQLGSEGLKPETITIGKDEILEISADVPASYTIELKLIK